MRHRLTHETDLTYAIIGLAMKVHSALGPGLLGSVYHRCLCHELTAGIAFEHEVTVPIRYDNVAIDTAYRADIIVKGEVILEVNRLSRWRVGLLLNFNTMSLKDGLRRFVR